MELLIVMAVIATLASILFPVFAKAKQSAGNSVCISNLKNLHGALASYLQDHDDNFPPLHLAWDVPQDLTGKVNRDEMEARERANPQSFPNVFGPYVKAQAVFRCPLDNGVVTSQDQVQGIRDKTCFERYGSSYRAAVELGEMLGLNLADVKDTTGIFWAADGAGYWHTKYSRMPLSQMVDDSGYNNDMPRWSSNTVFLDGHVRAANFMPDVWSPYVNFLMDRENIL